MSLFCTVAEILRHIGRKSPLFTSYPVLELPVVDPHVIHGIEVSALFS